MFDEVAVIIVSGGPVIETVFGRQVASQRHGAPFVCAEHHCGRPDKLAVLVHRKPVVLHCFAPHPALHPTYGADQVGGAPPRAGPEPLSTPATDR